MKKIILSCLLMLNTGYLFAQDRQAILKLMDTAPGLEPRRYGGFYAGLLEIGLADVCGSKTTYGWQNTLDNYKRGYPDKAAMGILTFDILKVQILDPENAFVFGGWHLQREKDNPGGYYTLWFRKINGEWKIVVDHTS